LERIVQIGNDLETSEIPYFTTFCIKSKERFIYLQMYKKFLIGQSIYLTYFSKEQRKR